jgi:hypothetical protein
MGAADYLGLKADYAMELNSGARRFGTLEVVFNGSSAVITDNSTQDVGGNTKGYDFSATTFSNKLVLNFTAGPTGVNLAMSFKLIAVP